MKLPDVVEKFIREKSYGAAVKTLRALTNCDYQTAYSQIMEWKRTNERTA